jgi:hypothetical protein
MLDLKERAQRNSPAGAMAAIGALLLVLLLSFASICSCVSVPYLVQQPYYSTEITTENRTESYAEDVSVARSTAHEQPLTPYILWSNPQLKFKGHTGIWYYAYDLRGFPVHAGERIAITFFRQHSYEFISLSVLDMSPRGQILAPPLISASDNPSMPVAPRNWIKGEIVTLSKWINLANIKLDFAHLLGAKTDLFLNTENAPPVELETRGARDIALIISGTEDPQNCRFVAALKWVDTITENVISTSERSVPTQVEHQVLKQRSVVQTTQVPFWEAFLGNAQAIPAR